MHDPRPEIQNLVERHPWTSVATAATVGAGLAVLLHPRSLLGRTMLVVVREVIRGVIFDKVVASVRPRVPAPVSGAAPPS